MLTALFGLFLYYHYHLTLVRQQELESRMHSEVFVESARLLQKEIDRARDVRHDLRHLLRELSTLSDEQATPEVRRCIERIEQLTRHVDTVFCDNRALNALLQYYAGLADEDGIPIYVAVVCGTLELPILAHDRPHGPVMQGLVARFRQSYRTDFLTFRAHEGYHSCQNVQTGKTFR